ncbi:MAG TPA: glycosyltransferase [Armatimonadota bacterium]|jgi:glycosyltransferase involved in cell wall biosynthesis
MSDTCSPLRLSLIIPTYRRRESLLRCLQGLAAGARRPDETLVVVHEQDPEAGDLEQALRELAAPLHLRLVWAERAGQIFQMNAGIAEATGDILCFTDDDCVPRPDWLAQLAAAYDDPRIGGVGGRDIVHHGEVLSEGPGAVVGRITWYGRVVGNHHLIFPPGRREVDHLKGANMSFRRESTPPLDPLMVLGPGTGSQNDTELSLAVRARGYRLAYEPLAQVDHYPAQRHGVTHRNLDHPQQVYLDAHNWAYLMFKHYGWSRRLPFLAYAALVGCGNRLGLAKFLVRAVRAPGPAGRQWTTTLRGLHSGLRTYYRAGRPGSQRRNAH